MRVALEATGYSRWFEQRLLAELGFEVWIGDPAQIIFPQQPEQELGIPAVGLLFLDTQLLISPDCVFDASLVPGTCRG